MTIAIIISTIIAIIAFICLSFLCYKSASQLQEIKDKTAQKREEIVDLLQKNNDLIEKNTQLENKIIQNKSFLIEYSQKENEKIEQIKNNLENAYKQYCTLLENSYKETENCFDKKKEKIKEEENNLNQQIKNLRQTFWAVTDAQLREQQMREKEKFFKIQVTKEDLAEIRLIQSIRERLRQPRNLDMLIWTSYYSKKANELCSRILGDKKITGIYKITNIKNNKVYIGQAVDVRDRLREHIKHGLGIDTPHNKDLYEDMLQYGLDDFCFELLESCEGKQLNEKECFYIETYKSYDYGYNNNRGIKNVSKNNNT